MSSTNFLTFHFTFLSVSCARYCKILTSSPFPVSQVTTNNTQNMASNSGDTPPGQFVCPSSPRPRPASVFATQTVPDEGAAAMPANTISDDPPFLPMILPLGPFGGRWTEGPPPGFEHVYGSPSLPTGNQIPHAGTVFGTEQRPPPVSTPEISSGSSPLDSSIFGNSGLPEDASTDAYFQAHPTSNHSRKGRVPFNRYAATGMEKCHAIASTRVVSFLKYTDVVLDRDHTTHNHPVQQEPSVRSMRWPVSPGLVLSLLRRS